MAILAPVAALIIVAAVVILALPHSTFPLDQLGGSPGQGPVAAGQGGKGSDQIGKAKTGPSSGNHGTSGRSGSAGSPSPGRSGSGPKSSGSASPSGHPTPSGKGSSSSKPSASGSPTKSVSSSPSPTPTPTPSQSSPAGNAPPAGYAWFSVSAATSGTIAGFQLAAPEKWMMTPGLNTVIRAPAGALKLAVDLATWAVKAPVKEARRLQASAIARGKYRDYQLLSITGTKFDGWPAARWTFWWQPAAAANPTEVVDLLFTAQTVDGPQQYIMLASAPEPRITAAERVLRVAMKTFAPLPG